MNAAARWIIGIAIVVSVGLVGLWYVGDPWRPTPPPPPRAADLDAVAARFPKIRDTLERILVRERQALHQRQARERLHDSLLTAGDTAGATRAIDEFVPPAERIGDRLRPPLRGESIAVSDSLIYVSAWTSRGRGFSAPYWSVGYAFASRPPEDPTVWPADLPSRLGRPYEAEYRHLDGPWYLYSRHEAFEGSD